MGYGGAGFRVSGRLVFEGYYSSVLEVKTDRVSKPIVTGGRNRVK